MLRTMIQHHDAVDADGNPAGGVTEATGIAIHWQNGPLNVDGIRKAPNGAFVEDVIENAVALGHLRAAAEVLEERTRNREDRGVEGTHTK